MIPDMFFDNWATLGRTVLVGALAYIAVVLIVRIIGKRTLSKLNSFDFIVTIALGSTLATILLNRDVSLAEGVVAFLLLVLLQMAITWLSIKSTAFQKLVRAEPRLVFHRGEFRKAAMADERVTEAEILQAIRSSGILALDDVEGVVLETSGSLSVVEAGATEGRTTLDELINT